MSQPKKFQKNAAAPFVVWQSDLIRRTGLTDEEFRRLRNRHCKKGVDYRTGKLNHIEFTEAGAKIMLDLAQKTPDATISAPLASAPDVTRDNTSPGSELTPLPTFAAPQDVPLRVVKIWPLNPLCLSAKNAAGETVTVRVRNNRLFRPDQEITGRLVEGTTYNISSKHRRVV